MIKYIKSVLRRVAKCLSYIEEARCLEVNITAPWKSNINSDALLVSNQEGYRKKMRKRKLTMDTNRRRKAERVTECPYKKGEGSMLGRGGDRFVNQAV